MALSTDSLLQCGQRIWLARLGDKTSFSNLAPQFAHTYSKIGILETPHILLTGLRTQLFLHQAGNAVYVHIPSKDNLAVDQHQGIGPVTALCHLGYVLELRAHPWKGDVIVRDRNLIAERVLEKCLCPTRGLLRRPPRASTPGAYLVLAVAQNDDLDLVFDCVLHLHSLINGKLLETLGPDKHSRLCGRAPLRIRRLNGGLWASAGLARAADRPPAAPRLPGRASRSPVPPRSRRHRIR